MIRRFVALVGVAGLLAGTLVLAPTGVAPTAAALPSVTVVGAATYDVRPEAATVHATVDITVANRQADTVIRRFYVDTVTLALPTGSSGFTASAGATKLRAAVGRRTATATMLTVTLPTRLYGGKSVTFRLGFDLVDRGGAATRALRVGTSLVTVGVIAFATAATPGASVVVRFPAGYQVDVAAGHLGAPVTAADGTITLSSGGLPDAGAFSAYLVATRPSDLVETPLRIAVGDRFADLAVRAWPDDAAWGKRTASLLERGLPLIGQAIGVPYPETSLVSVEESIGRELGGYAGIYDPSAARIRVDYAASAAVVLHEASHLWFNGSLFADRWIDEGFATETAALVAGPLKLPPGVPPLTAALLALRIPLNAWTGVQEPAAQEAFAYAASAEVASRIVALAGRDGLRAVFAAAAAGWAAYQDPLAAPATTGAAAVAPTPELGDAGPADWRTLLDDLAEWGHVDATDLWRTWVVRPEEASLLDVRGAARADYAALLKLAGDWHLPVSIRTALGAWRFDDARALSTRLRALLDGRSTIGSRADAIGLTPPPTLRAMFEDGSRTAAAPTEVANEIQVLDALTATTDARERAAGTLAAIGLLFSDPGLDLAAARTAFTKGDLPAALAQAALAHAAWAGARDLGGFRLRVVGAVGLVLGLAIALVAADRRRRRRRGLPDIDAGRR